MGIVVRQSFLNLISIGVAFLIGAVNTLYLYPTYLGSTFQGLVIALLAISNIVQPFISFGTQHAVIRYYSKYSKKREKDGRLTRSVLIPLIIIFSFLYKLEGLLVTYLIINFIYIATNYIKSSFCI